MAEKILVVDDSSDTREMMVRLLEIESFSVITAEDGRAGFDAATAEHPDLIITDIQMPRMNGIEMIRLLRAEVEFTSVPIMAIAAHNQNVAQEAVQAGANQATIKPIDFDSLIRGIRQLLGSAKVHRHDETSAAAQPLSLDQRRAFMKLPLEERRRILAEQAAQMAEQYASAEAQEERQSWQGGDIVEA